MALTWLPFYDVNASVGIGQINQQWDRNLIAFLTLFPYRENRFAPVLPFDASQDWLGVFNASGGFNEFMTRIAPFVQAMGYSTCSLNGYQVVNPAGGDYKCRTTIVALNDLLYRNYSALFFTPLDWPLSGLTQNGIRQFLANNRFSPWFNLPAPQAAARFQLPFYDVTDSVGPGQPNQTDDAMLVRYFLNAVFQLTQFKPVPKPVETEFRNGPTPGATKWASLAHFADRSGAYGIPVKEEQIVRPTGGDPGSGSTIHSINYWAQKLGTERYCNLIGVGLLPGVLPGQPLRSSLAVNRKSQYFGVGGSRRG
ncbi:MAG: hypothetical protein JST93_16830 [Acidobacteria bacterium]|nr:hypothetical protein [Acidobacteriota bacterium]